MKYEFRKIKYEQFYFNLTEFFIKIKNHGLRGLINMEIFVKLKQSTQTQK